MVRIVEDRQGVDSVVRIVEDRQGVDSVVRIVEDRQGVDSVVSRAGHATILSQHRDHICRAQSCL